MTRWIFTAVAIGVVTVLSAPGCGATGVGDPCTPDQEYETDFPGFQVGEVSIESKSFTCLSRLCLVNHFQGRVSCPFGQECAAPPAGAAASSTCASYVGRSGGPGNTPGGPGCFVPGTKSGDGGTCTPAYGSCQISAEVLPQLTGPNAGNRTTSNAVYCSCRCANEQGQTNDGGNYCACPDGFKCEQLVASISAGTTDLSTGGYCIKNGTAYDKTIVSNPCLETTSLDPTSKGLPNYCPQVD